MVWVEHTTTWDVYLKDLTGGAEMPVAAGPGDQFGADVSGDHVVWMYDRDLHLMNLPTGITKKITNTWNLSEGQPSVSGDYVVYTEEDRSIYLYTISTGTTTLLTSSGYSTGVKAFGDRIVFARSLVQNGAPNFITVATLPDFKEVASFGGVSVRNPVLDGDWVAWADSRSGNSNIYLANLKTGQEIRVSPNIYPQGSPSLKGDVLVWTDYRTGRGELYLYRISKGTVTRLVSDPARVTDVVTDGSRVFWSDNRIDTDADLYIRVLDLTVNHPPTAQIGGPYSAVEGVGITFNSAGSSDPDGDALSYQWDFTSDGTTDATVPTPTHSYVDQGSYTAKLTVADGRGGQATATASVSITNAAPAVIAGRDTSFTLGKSYTLSGSFMDWGSSDQPWAYKIDWGDGTSPTTGTALTPGALTPAPHTYTAQGTYTVTLTVQDKEGALGKDELVVTTQPNRAPVASVNGPYAGNEGGGIALSSNGSSDPDGDPITYRWTFGDGTSSTVANPTKKYSDNGSYTVTLTLKDAAGLTSSASTSVTVNNVAPTGSLSASNLVEGSAYTISFNTTDVGTLDRSSLQMWVDCGQGVGYQALGAAELSSEEVSAEAIKSVSCSVEPDQVSRTIRGKVRDKDGGEREYTKVVAIANAAPVVTLTATSATTIPLNGSVSFEGLFTDKGLGDSPWSWTMVWGDGLRSTGSATAQNAVIPLSHTYAKAGTLYAQLQVKDKDGKLGSSTKITITVNP